MEFENRLKSACVVLLLATVFLALPTGAWSALSSVCTFEVEGMTCASCPLQVKTALKRIDGLQRVRATLLPPKAKVAYDGEKTTVGAIARAISDIGYSANPIDCKE